MDAKWISMLPALVTLCCCMTGCGANRFQHAADKSLLIQENLQLDQALSITQYELMLVQQENDVLRRQLEQVSQSSGVQSGGTSGNTSSGRLPSLRSTYEPMATAPTFDVNDPNLPSPSNQMPQHFQRPQQSLPSDFPPGTPQWSPQRGQ